MISNFRLYEFHQGLKLLFPFQCAVKGWSVISNVTWRVRLCSKLYICHITYVICVAATESKSDGRWGTMAAIGVKSWGLSPISIMLDCWRDKNPLQVMNLFLRKLGVPDVWSVQDVWGLEPDLLAMLPTPVLGVMLLFPVNDHYRNAAQVRYNLRRTWYCGKH